MVQGLPTVIPLNRNIGLQNIAHVIVHVDAEPDLGRKGFQPEILELAQKLAVWAVSDFGNKFWHLLRHKTGIPVFQEKLKLSDWIEKHKEHAKGNPLTIKGRGLFMPTEELPILSFPLVEQDVVALFNQMLSSGVIRGIRILSSSSYKQYDALYQVVLEAPMEKYVYHKETNPLGVDQEMVKIGEGKLLGFVEVLEYKYSVDALIEEFGTEMKRPEDIGLVVAWEMGDKWDQYFKVASYLDPDNVHHRPVHGFTHTFTHAMSGLTAFEAIILHDLVDYLQNPEQEGIRQQLKYSEHFD
jgi:hypothetical protein